MKRKILILGLGITLTVNLFSPAKNITFAAQGNGQLENQKKQVQNKRSNIQSEINIKQNELNEIKVEKAAVGNDIKKLDLAVAETSSNIQKSEAEIKEAKNEIERLNKEIEILKEQIRKRDELLKERFRTIQETGGVISYLDVLLGAQSFGDFISRVSAVTTFVQADQDLIKVHQENKAQLDNNEMEVRQQVIQLNENMAELEGMRKKLKSQIEEKNNIMNQLDLQEEEADKYILSLEDEESILADQEKAIKREIVAWNKRQRELEEQRKKQADTKNVPQVKGKSLSSSSAASPPAVTSGTFMRPATGRVTSEYGQRWGTLHSGIDIGKNGRTGDVPIVASAAGTVIRANYSGSYGNVVMISHYIDGKVMTTVYAHQERLIVSSGDQVEKGQIIGYMGNTGQSTGPHLHFEIHEGTWNGSRSNSVNPRNYLAF